MTTADQPQTLSRTLAVCAECEAEVVAIECLSGDVATLRPCGHVASLMFIDNPELCVP